MTQTGKLLLSLAGLFALVFIADVTAGAFFRAAFLSDVAQALLLAISCSFFVAALLVLEGQKKNGDPTITKREEETL